MNDERRTDRRNLNALIADIIYPKRTKKTKRNGAPSSLTTFRTPSTKVPSKQQYSPETSKNPSEHKTH